MNPITDPRARTLNNYPTPKPARQPRDRFFASIRRRGGRSSALKVMLGTSLAVTMFATILLAGVDAKPASAATCWGDWCSGQDPAATGCDADAYTAASARVWGTTFHVELRWSPSFGTGWARVPATWADSYPTRFRVQQDTRYEQVGRVNSNSNYAWTRMIYSRVPCIRAQWTGAPGFTSTAWFC